MDKAATSEDSAARQNEWAGVGEMQREMLGFMAARLQKDIEAIRQMAAHPDLNHAFSVQSRWLAETVHDYLVESEKLVTMISGPASKFMLAGTDDKEAPVKVEQSVA